MTLLVVMLTTLATNAQAGPPLISDDPHTVGAGRLEVIAAASGFGYTNSVELIAPAVDLTLGLVTGLDLALVVSPLFTLSPDRAATTDPSVVLGAKLQPLRGEHWNASFSPAGALNPAVVGGSNVVFPVQLEYARTRLFVGADGGYVLDLDDTDLWYVNVYGGWNASDSLQLLGEVWSGQSTLDRRVEIGLTFGLDWTTRSGMHLLAAGGPGIAASPGRRVRWHFYVGLQWNFALWSRD